VSIIVPVFSGGFPDSWQIADFQPHSDGTPPCICRWGVCYKDCPKCAMIALMAIEESEDE